MSDTRLLLEKDCLLKIIDKASIEENLLRNANRILTDSLRLSLSENARLRAMIPQTLDHALVDDVWPFFCAECFSEMVTYGSYLICVSGVCKKRKDKKDKGLSREVNREECYSTVEAAKAMKENND